MKVLFYVEPLIELGRPYWKEGWLKHWSIPVANDFCARGDEVRICASEALVSRLSDGEKANVVSFSHGEMTCDQRWDYLQLSGSWFDGSYSDEMLDYYKGLLRGKLKSFEPDLIMTFTTVPFLKELFPSAVILHREYALFSRPPFPETGFLDPLGPCGGGAGKAAHLVFEDPRGIIFGDKEREDLERLRRVVRETCLKDNPYVGIFKILRDQYSHLILLPCQFSDYYLFDSHMRFQNQFEFVVYCMDRIPRDIGVVVTLHPEHGVLSGDALKFLSDKYPNFIYSKTFECVFASTQVILPFVDAVVTVSSTVAFQCLIWKKKIISLGGVFLKGLADSRDLAGMHALLDAEYLPKEQVLYWMLNAYALPKTLAFSVEKIVAMSQRIADIEGEWDSQKVQHVYSECSGIDYFIHQIQMGSISYRADTKDCVVKCELRSTDGSIKDRLFFDLEEHGDDLVIESGKYGDFSAVVFDFSRVARVLSLKFNGLSVGDEQLRHFARLTDGTFFVDEEYSGVVQIEKTSETDIISMRILASGEDAYKRFARDLNRIKSSYVDEVIRMRRSNDELEKIKSSCVWQILSFIFKLKSKVFRYFSK